MSSSEFRRPRSTRAGFSLLEIIIAVAILLVVSAVALVALSQFRTTADVNRAADALVSLLNGARERTIAGTDNAQWGVHLTASEFKLFQGQAFSGTSVDTFTLPFGTTASWALAGGGDDIVFNRIDGTTSQNGTVTLTRAGQTRVVTIFVSGQTAIASTLPAQLPGARVTDTRHVHFTLPYALSSFTTMTLTFSDPPNPDTVVTINIPDQMNNGQFLWEGTTDVQGSPQHLRIITHSIGVSTTNLSVHRDRMENNKALVISVDGTVAATYTATGTVSGGIGVSVAVQ